MRSSSRIEGDSNSGRIVAGYTSKWIQPHW
jgi:hypothetical protein